MVRGERWRAAVDPLDATRRSYGTVAETYGPVVRRRAGRQAAGPRAAGGARRDGLQPRHVTAHRRGLGCQLFELDPSVEVSAVAGPYPAVAFPLSAALQPDITSRSIGGSVAFNSAEWSSADDQILLAFRTGLRIRPTGTATPSASTVTAAPRRRAAVDHPAARGGRDPAVPAECLTAAGGPGRPAGDVRRTTRRRPHHAPPRPLPCGSPQSCHLVPGYSP